MKRAACRACLQAITWQSRGGKFYALDADGGNHWAHCRGRKQAQPEIHKGRHIVGEHYAPSCGRCDVPPWEPCACSALLPCIEGMAERINAEADAQLALRLAA